MIFVVLVVVLLGVESGAIIHQHRSNSENSRSHHGNWESFDQANLKQGDAGCPTAIYRVNPETKLLEQCPPY